MVAPANQRAPRGARVPRACYPARHASRPCLVAAYHLRTRAYGRRLLPELRGPRKSEPTNPGPPRGPPRSTALPRASVDHAACAGQSQASTWLPRRSTAPPCTKMYRKFPAVRFWASGLRKIQVNSHFSAFFRAESKSGHRLA